LTNKSSSLIRSGLFTGGAAFGGSTIIFSAPTRGPETFVGCALQPKIPNITDSAKPMRQTSATCRGRLVRGALTLTMTMS
jgi:hypothetical protein